MAEDLESIPEAVAKRPGKLDAELREIELDLMVEGILSQTAGSKREARQKGIHRRTIEEILKHHNQSIVEKETTEPEGKR